MTGFRSGADFADLFDPDIIGDGPTAWNYRSGAAVRFAHIQYGQQRADVGYRIDGVDVARMWAAKGTAAYYWPFHGKGFSSGNQAKTNSRDTCSASVRLALSPDGTYTITKSNTGGGNNSNTVAESGRWLPNGQSAAEYEVQIVGDGDGRASFSTSAPGFSPMTSAQSASVGISVASASSSFVQGSVSVRCLVRRAGRVQESSFSASVSASGWY